jgi:hypothetical protein
MGHGVLSGIVLLPGIDCCDEHSPVSNRFSSPEFAGDSMGSAEVSFCPRLVLIYVCKPSVRMACRNVGYPGGGTDSSIPGGRIMVALPANPPTSFITVKVQPVGDAR